MKTTHLAELEKEIVLAKGDLQLCQKELDRQNGAIREAVTKGLPEQEVEKLQLSRDLVSRRHERLTLTLEALEARRPDAAQQDAKEQLPHLEKSLQSRAKRIHEAYAGLVTAAEALEKALTLCEATQADCEDVKTIEAEITTLCETYALDCPALPGVPPFPEQLTFATPGLTEPFLRELLSRAYRLEQWRPVAKQTRELTEEQQEAKRQAEAWLQEHPATRCHVFDLHPQAVFFLPKDLYEAERRKELPAGHPKSTQNNWVPAHQIARG